MYKNVHFIGIGGISMSAIAKILLSKGVSVSGSDITETPITRELEKMGAKITIPHCADCIENPDIIVYTSAIKSDNPEMVAALEKNIPLVERADMVGNIMKNYSFPVAVAGTHGKTTSTSMMAYTLMESGLDPTVMVGGELDILGGNLHVGKSGYMVTEACEYCRNFLKFAPFVGIILNVEEDHLDYYRDLDDIIDAFSSFSSLIPQNGYLIVNGDDENAVKASKSAKCNVITAGIQNGDFRGENISYDDFGYPTFDVTKNGEKLTTVTLSVPGEHNIYNALCIIVATYCLTKDTESIKKGIEKFSGTKRRFEKKGEKDGVLIVDDYAHHPTEIRATLRAVNKIKAGKVWCVFQPHTYTRTKALFNDFAKVLSEFENIIITDIYAAREKDTGLVSSKDLADAVEGALYLSTFKETADFLREHASSGDIVLTMGAGDVFKIGEMLL